MGDKWFRRGIERLSWCALSAKPNVKSLAKTIKCKSNDSMVAFAAKALKGVEVVKAPIAVSASA